MVYFLNFAKIFYLQMNMSTNERIQRRQKTTVCPRHFSQIAKSCVAPPPVLQEQLQCMLIHHSTSRHGDDWRPAIVGTHDHDDLGLYAITCK